jgi:hypothetical protein
MFDMPTPPFSPPGTYSVAFIPTAPSSPGVVGGGAVLTPGSYRVAGAGGSRVGAFSVDVPFPASFTWTNRAAINVVRLNEPLTVTWTGGTSGALAYIHGRSGISATVGVDFTCWEDAAAGSFTVPTAVLSALPPSYRNPNGEESGVLDVYQFFLTGIPFSASGIDYAWATWADGHLKGGVAFR